MSNKIFSEVVATPVESAPIKPVRPVSSSPTLPHSKDTEVTRDSSEEFDAVTLRTLISPRIESWTPHSDLCTGMAQEFSGDPSLETRSAISQWLDRRPRNLPPIGANREDDRTARDALALTGDGDKSADLDSDLFPYCCTTPNDAIGSLEPDDVDIDAVFNQYLCSPSPLPPPTSSPDDMTSELSGATLCDARRDPSRSYSELYTRTSKSPAPEMSPESEIARDRDDPCYSANRTCIYLRVGQPKITLRLRL